VAARQLPPLACLGSSAPAGFTLDYYYNMTCGECRDAGDAGIAAGVWREYRCTTAPIGLDVVYPLYVR
jgi:hypothetical protein